jgi:hypothetical protein
MLNLMVGGGPRGLLAEPERKREARKGVERREDWAGDQDPPPSMARILERALALMVRSTLDVGCRQGRATAKQGSATGRYYVDRGRDSGCFRSGA